MAVSDCGNTVVIVPYILLMNDQAVILKAVETRIHHFQPAEGSTDRFLPTNMWSSVATMLWRLLSNFQTCNTLY